MKIIEGAVTAPRGFLAQGVCAEVKKKDQKDLAIVFSKEKCTCAAVYTTNRVRAACIDINKENLRDGFAQAVVVNSGNANACTGEQGLADARQMGQATAEALNIKAGDVVVASTGVIGVYMPMDRVIKGIQRAAEIISKEGSHNASLAIMTTDLKPKEIAVEIEIQGKPVRIGAMAKGSGMIHPNMATMLAFITTDAAIDNICLEKMIKNSTDRSYNMISVDRDTSTNDMVVIMANGLAGNRCIDDIDSRDYQKLQEAIDFVNISLAKMIARDGEGATRLIEVRVINASDLKTARFIGRSITGSNLTKTAVFGEDANWGRILAAAGYSQADFDPAKVDIYLGQEKMAENGRGLLFDEDKAREELRKDPVSITFDLKSGNCEATAWGCDLSYEYIRINAEYRT
jgi:glutamate N-acetyltransferase/amino-acid N-acetyltransferase